MIKKITLITSLFMATSVWGGIFSTDYVCKSEKVLEGLLLLDFSTTASLSINSWLNKATIGSLEYDYTDKGNKIIFKGETSNGGLSSKDQYSFDLITKKLSETKEESWKDVLSFRTYECKEV